MASSNYLYPIINTIGVILVLIINTLANILPLGGRSTGEISQQYSNLFVPAGYAFSIWGIIYLLLINFVIFGWVQGLDNQLYQQVSWLFVLTCLFNVAWLFLWHYDQIWLSTLAMTALLVTLVVIYSTVRGGADISTDWEKIALHTTFSIYLGWICVATVANFSAALTSSNWQGLGLSEEFWFVFVTIVVLLVVVPIIGMFGDISFGVVIVWSFLGIAVKYSENQIVLLSSIGSVIIVGSTMVWLLAR